MTPSPGSLSGGDGTVDGVVDATPSGLVDRLGGALARYAAAVAALTGWRRAVLAVLAGAASTLALAPFHWSFVLLATLPALVWLADGCHDRIDDDGARRIHLRGPVARAAAVGWLFGFGYHFVGLIWIGEAFLVEAEVFAWLLPFALTLLPAGLALFFAAAFAAAAAVRTRTPGLARVVALAVAITAAEWLRGHILTGFPWNVLGYALTHPLVLMQSAGLVGVYGLTLLAVLVFALPAVALVGPGRGLARLSGAAVALSILVVLTAYGALRLAVPEPPAAAGVRLRVVQPSVPQREKWRPERQREFFLEHLDLSTRRPDGTPDGLAGITHVVWPEAAMPFQPLRTPEALQMIAATLPAGVHLIAGALRSELAAGPGSRLLAFNSLMVFGPDGGLAGLYDKTHLVPFGEYLPFQETMESIGIEQLTRQRGGFTAGRTPRPLLVVPGLPLVGPLICYEAIFPAAVIAGSERPGVLVNLTNDGWFGTGTGPYQHFHQARVRAVEEGMPLVRAANNGISALVDSRGRVRGRLELNRKGTLDVELPSPIGPPLYARWGDGLTIVAVALAMLGLAFSPARRA